jgi:hypothetical protein
MSKPTAPSASKSTATSVSKPTVTSMCRCSSKDGVPIHSPSSKRNRDSAYRRRRRVIRRSRRGPTDRDGRVDRAPTGGGCDRRSLFSLRRARLRDDDPLPRVVTF